MNFPRQSRNHAGFTLIELTISAALMAVVLTSAYLCLSAGLSSQKIIEPRSDIIQSARVALALMSADLRSACPLPKGAPFLGIQRRIGDVEADNLDFATHNYTPRRDNEGDFCEESFYLDRNPKSGKLSLWRRRNPTMAFDPLSGGSREEIAKGLRSLELAYYDGFDWYNTWGDAGVGDKKLESSRAQPNLFGMPEAVRITLSFDSNPKSIGKSSLTERDHAPEPPLVFRTVVRLELAASLTDSSSGNANPGEGDQSGERPAPGANR